MGNLSRADWEDAENIQRIINSYSQRYGEKFWQAFVELAGSESRNTIADFGCGPGLFLVDAVKHYKANKVYGFDMSKNMLKQASHFLQNVLRPEDIVLRVIDFDKDPIPLEQASINLGFSGYMLHEVQNPQKFVDDVQRLVKNNGIYIIFDFISGNPEAFMKIMSERGMPQDQAKKRYPHMCKHSLSDIRDILRNAGFSTLDYIQLDEVRAIVKGIKRPAADLEVEENNCDKIMPTDRYRSPWAYDSSEMKCPKCHSRRIFRVLDRWGRSKGIQMFECAVCGKRFYDRGVDDYRPTFPC